MILEIKNIETYYDLIYALRGVSLSVEEGTITTILGNNGAGKSTILKTVMGLIEDQPDKGDHRVPGPSHRRQGDGRHREARALLRPGRQGGLRGAHHAGEPPHGGLHPEGLESG